MKNILLVLQREYLVRVKKKSFIIMTFLTPFLFVGFYAAMIWIAIGSTDSKTVEVLDESGLFTNQFRETDELKFNYIDESLESAKAAFTQNKDSEVNALVFIPKDVLDNPKDVRIYAAKSVSLDLKSDIENTIERQIENIKLTEAGITRKVIEDARVNVKSETISLNEEGEKSSSSGAATIIGGICAFMIYLSVFVYGTQVMRGVTEEKTSRIVEVIISSVKPYQLMMGKIVGVALVGLTQFMLWILLTVLFISAAGYAFKDKIGDNPQAKIEQVQKNMPASGAMSAAAAAPGDDNPVSEVLAAVNSLNIPYIIACFLFYYLGGYFFYSALFGAVGAAVDNDADTQQFMLPITMPIIISFFFAQFALRDPDGPLAFWASMVPFTSPIVMMVRVPFGVPGWQLALSMVLLVLGVMGTVWLAARIYRVGILMYGKKVSYKELGKWLFYKV